MKNFSKFIGNMAKIVTKIVEVFQWVGAGMMLAATICALVNPDWIGYFIGFDACESCGAKLSVITVLTVSARTEGRTKPRLALTTCCMRKEGRTHDEAETLPLLRLPGSERRAV